MPLKTLNSNPTTDPQTKFEKIDFFYPIDGEHPVTVTEGNDKALIKMIDIVEKCF